MIPLGVEGGVVTCSLVRAPSFVRFIALALGLRHALDYIGLYNNEYTILEIHILF